MSDIPKKRTAISFLSLFLFLVLVYGSWVVANTRVSVNGRPGPFRAVLEFNGKIWGSLFSPTTKARGNAPIVGKAPRVNGLVGLESEIDLTQWKLEIDPDDENEKSEILEVSLAELKALPRVETTTEFRCIEGWSEEISYAGVRFSDFLTYYHLGAPSGKISDASKPPKDLFRYVGLQTPDEEYYVSIDMESMLHSKTVLAYEMNGKPLDLKNGAPLRLIIPVKYGIKNLKRIGRIFFSNTRPPDYWEERGYDWFSGL